MDTHSTNVVVGMRKKNAKINISDIYNCKNHMIIHLIIVKCLHYYNLKHLEY